MSQLPPGIAGVRETVKAWERLRVIYNIVLLVPGTWVAIRAARLEFPPGLFPGSYPELVFQCVVFGAAANVFYCLGPYAEFLVTALGFPVTARRIRYFLFGFGLLLSLLVIGFAALMIELSGMFPAPP